MTEHFTIEELSRSETATRKGIDNHIPHEYLPNAKRVAQTLEIIRAHFGPVRVTSCYRGVELNRIIGGSNTSAHCRAMAADFEIEGHANIEVARWCAENIKDYDQVIYEFGPTGWVHIGLADKPRRQQLTAIKEKGKTVYLPGIKEV